MRAYKPWHCNAFQNCCCLCSFCNCAKMGITSNHWHRSMIESIVTTSLKKNQKNYGSLNIEIEVCIDRYIVRVNLKIIWDNNS